MHDDQGPKQLPKPKEVRECDASSRSIRRLSDNGEIMRISGLGYGIVSAARSQGERTRLEDFYISRKLTLERIRHGEGRLMAVMDGHSGKSAAREISSSLYGLFVKSLSASKGDVETALRRTVSKLAELTDKKASGTTLSIVYIPADERKAYVAVVGDSPVAVTDAKFNVWVSPTHNVKENEAERRMAEQRGGFYDSGYNCTDPGGPGLQMSRALGDAPLARILSREPDICSVGLSEDSVVMLATDGIFSHGIDSKSQITRIFIHVRQWSNAKDVVADALNRRTNDNVTVLIWRARPLPRKQDDESEIPF